MKVSKIASQYGISRYELETYILQSEFPHSDRITGLDLDESVDVGTFISAFKSFQEEKKAQEEAAKAKQQAEEQEKKIAAEEKRKALASMLITSGFNFDGYTITKYSGYISGDDVIQIDRGRQGIFAETTDVGDALSGSLVKIRRNALTELKEAAYALGCNAVIGVDFDYITLEPETVNASGGTLYLPYVFCVTANGNAVIIEKDK